MRRSIIMALGIAAALAVGLGTYTQASYKVKQRWSTSLPAGALTIPAVAGPAQAKTARTFAVSYEDSFDDASTECAYFIFDLPANNEGANLSVCPKWMANAVTGDVKWGIDMALVGNSGIYGGATAKSTTFAIAADGTAYDLVATCGTLSSLDSGAGLYTGRLCRVGGSTTDTMVGDAILVSLALSEVP